MIELIYFSSAIKEMTESECLEILEVSRLRNEEDAITGILLYAGGNFMQIIEGDDDKVMSLYGRIYKDPRHHVIITIGVNKIESRAFSDWAMGFKYFSKEEACKLEGFSEFMNKNITPENILDNQNLIIDMLSIFKKNNR